jgi:microcin C transport system substrate-binding protein
MSMALKLPLILLFLVSFAAPAGAEGLAMHGQPKYTPKDTHVEYANPDAPKGGDITMAAIGTFDTLNPYSIKGKAAQGLNLVYDRLMTRVWDEPFTMYPLIAERVEVPEDRSSITVFINPKAKFHDGTPITADDVLFSFETLKTQGRPNMRQIYKLVDKAEKRDERTVYFHFGPGYDRETVMILAMMPVLSKAWWSGKTFDQTTLDIPLLNGPYKIKSFEPGRRIVYERVADYWAKNLLPNVGHNNFAHVTYDYYRDDLVAFESFKSGDVGLRREFDAGKWASEAYAFPAAKDGRTKLEALPHGRPEKVRSFIFNTRRAPFDDIRVREAFNLLFDFEWANHNLFHDQYKRINSYFPNSELAATGVPSAAEREILEKWRKDIPASVFGEAYKPPVSSTPQERRENMRKADKLLNNAGWLVVDGKRMKNGKPLTFEIMLGAPEDEKTALHFKRSLEKMGIDVRVRVLDAAAYIGRLNEYDFDMTLYFWLNTLSPGTEQPLYWSCHAAEEKSRWNYAGICNPAVDALAGSIASSTSREDLVTRVHALDRILTHGYYMVPISYNGVDYVGYWKPVQRPLKTPLYGMVIETWWMDTAPKPKQD